MLTAVYILAWLMAATFIGVAFWLRAQVERTSSEAIRTRKARQLGILATIVAGLSLIGLLLCGVKVLGAVGGASVDPSQGAFVVADTNREFYLGLLLPLALLSTISVLFRRWAAKRS